jgi:hypothetical protein
MELALAKVRARNDDRVTKEAGYPSAAPIHMMARVGNEHLSAGD